MRKNNAVRVIIIYTLIAGSFFLYQSWKRYTLSQDLSTGKYLEERFKQDSLFSLKKGIPPASASVSLVTVLSNKKYKKNK